jgi:hypothetical protein
MLNHDSQPALDLSHAIRSGDSAALNVLLDKHEGLASARIERHGGTITPLHLATDWPGYYPDGPEVVRILVAKGADANAATEGSGNPETPLHWAASSDDVDVAEALIDLGADVMVPGGSIGTPLANAVGYGCWHVARLLVARGAPVEHLWQAAALGLTRRVVEVLDAAPATTDELNHAFWQACHGGQLRTAQVILSLGAEIDATPWHSEQTPLDIAGETDTRRATMTEWLRKHGAHSALPKGDETIA